MPARTLFVGLDSLETTLADPWMDEGRLPTLAGLAEHGRGIELTNSVELLTGSVWSELATGRSVGRSGRYFHVRQLRSGETAPRPLELADVDPTSMWSLASEAGLRVAAIDVPQSVPAPGVNGPQLIEHTTHEHCYGTLSDPPDLLDEIRGRLGAYPVPSCEEHDRSLGAYEDMLDGLLASVEYKRRMVLELLDREEWDLFATAFSETHCVGHQFFEFQDGWDLADGTPAPPRLRTAMRDVYGATDAALADVIAAAGDDAAVFVVASHGMGFMPRGPQLLPEFLVRIGLGSGGGAVAQARSRMPIGLRGVLRGLVPASLRRRVQGSAGSLPRPLESPSTRAVAVPANRSGAIRLNVAGRDPHGAVPPGEVPVLADEIRRELAALQNADGEPIVERVVTADEAFGSDHHDDLPDVMVVFRSDIGPIEECRSERVGTISPGVSTGHMDWRGGDHTPRSRMWVAGPVTDAVGGAGAARAIDVAPTLLALLGVPLDDRVDGRPLVEAPV